MSDIPDRLRRGASERASGDAMSPENTKTRRFKVGDIVRFQFDETDLDGEVVEDRGDLGVGGEQIVRVRAEFDLGLVRETEMRASRLTWVQSPN